VFASAAFMIAVGLVPALGRLAGRIPSSISSAMLVGVLLPFCLELFRLGATHPHAGGGASCHLHRRAPARPPAWAKIFRACDADVTITGFR
jgi:hypothetical protein